MLEWETVSPIWDVPDDLWERIEPVILAVGPAQSPGAQTGLYQRKMLEGYLSHAQRLPVEPLAQGVGNDNHPSDLPALGRGGVLEGIWAALIEECQELGGVDWEWQSADCSMGVKRGWGGRHWTQPHRPGQSWEQEEHPGGRSWRPPMSVVVAGANVRYTKLLRIKLLGEIIVVAGPEGTQNLSNCAWTKGMTIPPATGPLLPSGTDPHIRRIGEEKLDRRGKKTFPARRWVVVRTLIGSPSAGGYWCATPRSPPITWACFNWLASAHCTAVNVASLFCQTQFLIQSQVSDAGVY